MDKADLQISSRPQCLKFCSSCTGHCNGKLEPWSFHTLGILRRGVRLWTNGILFIAITDLQLGSLTSSFLYKRGTRPSEDASESRSPWSVFEGVELSHDTFLYLLVVVEDDEDTCSGFDQVLFDFCLIRRRDRGEDEVHLHNTGRLGGRSYCQICSRQPHNT